MELNKLNYDDRGYGIIGVSDKTKIEYNNILLDIPKDSKSNIFKRDNLVLFNNSYGTVQLIIDENYKIENAMLPLEDWSKNLMLKMIEIRDIKTLKDVIKMESK